MRPRKPDLFLPVAVVGGVAYPLLVYVTLHKIPAVVFVLLGLSLIALRLAALRAQPDFRLWAAIFGVASLVMVAGLFAFPAYAAQTYPVLVSLSVASAFGLSLIFPPTLVERIARLTEPNLPSEGVLYTRKVTIMWAVALMINAAISASLAIWGSLDQWTLWNGLLSYLLMGVLFAGEYAVRRKVRQ